MKDRNNILIVRDFDAEYFWRDRNRSQWRIFSLKEFIANYKRLLKRKYGSLVIGSHSIQDKNLRYPIEFLMFFVRAKKKYFIDNQGNIKRFSFWKFLVIDTPLFIGELFFDLVLIVLTWFVLIPFYLLSKRKCKRGLESKTIIYFRTDNFRGQQEGGSFTHFRGVMEGFSKLGYKVNYIGSDKIQVPNLDFPQIIIPYPLKFNLLEIPEIYYNWRFIPRVLKIVKGKRPAFIYQRHSIFNVCGAVVSQLTGVSLILEYNGSEPWIRQKWGGLLIFRRLCYFMENISLKKADIITVVSRPMKEELLKRGIAAKKILVNYNGVDSEDFNPNIDGSGIRKKYNLKDKIVIGAVSTFGAWHGMPILARAVKLIIQKFQIPNSKFQIHFLFIGDGVERPRCERIIRGSKMEKYVTFTGTVPFAEISRYLAACDILVSPHIPNSDGTPFFGSPTKLFEYMAMGKGIVASNLDQIGEVLEHKKTAWLVKPGDVNDLANGIIKLIEDRDLRKKLGKNTREVVVKNYTWRQNVKRIINFYEKQIKI